MTDIDASYMFSDADDDFQIESDCDESDFDFENDDPAPVVAKSKPKAKATKASSKPKAKAKATSKAKPAAKSKSTKSKAKAPKKAAGKKLNDINLDDSDDDLSNGDGEVAILGERSVNTHSPVRATTAAKKKSKKTVEETYTKMTQLEHILLRPDTYIGSIERVTEEMWVLQDDEIAKKQITFTPGLYKIYDEILVNAADNKQRDSNMDRLDIDINAAENKISVKNNGKGIPVEWHKDHQCYVPSLVFGHLLTGSNFNDDEAKTTGGRNGYGAKLANIFSTEFTVECADSERGKMFSQTFHNNMNSKTEPKIKDMTDAQMKKGDFTKITFSPDLAKFKMDRLDEDAVALLSKRAYDLAGSMAHCEGKLMVSLNGKKLAVKNFEKYLNLYKGIDPPSAYEIVNDRWEVGIGVTDGIFEQVSFVNAISTSKGGEHVNYIADQVSKRLAATIEKKNKGGVPVKPTQIKNYLSIFVNTLVANPSFDSQTKEFLTTKKSKFGSTCVLTEKFLKKVEKSGVVESILRFAKFKEKEALGKKGAGRKKVKLTGIVKLDDANFAGGAKSKDCTLILTEGDSAKSLAMSGLSVVGRDYYGVFPLKGKLLNVRDAAFAQITKNEEIKNVIDIMGLSFNTVYDETNIKTLRYGHLMIMADQDYDGSHIKGLVINFIHHFWPSLLDIPGFLQQFITPIVKAKKGKQVKTFFTLPEYDTWRESTGNEGKGWHIKYFKGLGTSTSAEAKDYFSHLDQHEINFVGLNTDDGKVVDIDIDSDSEDSLANATPDQASSGSDLITMAFSKKDVEKRKTWLNNLEKDTFLDYSEAQIEGVKFSDFINKELILFSQHDVHRSIPNVLDGFKPSQRKVLFGCFLKNLKNEMKVAQLCGYIGEKAAYHHGEMSLQGTIVNMAQDYVGSNNVNLLTPSGQFGTRRMGGKDHASARYIFTKLEKITRAVFHPDDDAILNYLSDDGESIEPDFYMPVIPLILVNGSEGIGTGWSTNIPNYDPREIIANLRCKIKGEQMKEMHPRYFGFTGDIKANASGKNNSLSYDVIGKVERPDDETLFISELPVKKWTQDYKVFLEKMMIGDTKKNKEPEIRDFKENHTDTTVSFTITASKEQIDAWEAGKGGLLQKLQLTSKLSTSNMNAFDEHGRIIKFENALKIIDHFYEQRLKYYTMRKDHMLKNMRREERMLSNKARFIEEVCAGDLVVSNRKRTEILSELKSRGYELFSKEEKSREDSEDSEEDEDDNSSDAELSKGYEYLLGMKIWSLTHEKAEKLRQELAEKTKAVRELEAMSESTIWENDLLAVAEALDERDAFHKQAALDELEAQQVNGKRKKGGAKSKKRVTKKKTKKSDGDSDDDFAMEKAPKKKPVRKAATAASTKRSTTKQLKITDTVKLAPTVKKTAPKPKRPVKTLTIEDSDSESESMTLKARFQKKSAAKSVSNPKKRASPRSDISEDLESFVTADFEPAALTPAPKKVKRSDAINLDSDSDSDSDEEPVQAKKATQRKPAAKRKLASKAKPASKSKPIEAKKSFENLDFLDDDEEEEFDEDALEDSDAEVEVEAFPPPRSRSGRSRKAVTYQLDSDSDSDF
uniref:DNA topoisomerase 2 n=1 Tax=Chaetoceros debilis TaxID=122233 RepID=A0A7S3VBL7_9STRA